MALNIEFDLRDLKHKSNTKLYPLFRDQTRFLVVWGSAGSGKSIWAIDKHIFRILTESTGPNPIKHTFVIARKVGNTLKHTVWKDFISRLSDWGLMPYAQINKSEMSITFPDFNDSSILFKGLDDNEKIKSLNITGVWIEEATDVDEDDFRQLNARLRVKSKYYQTLLTFNPDDESHWIRQRFFDDDAISPLDGTIMKCVHTSYVDNKFIDILEYERTLIEMGKGNPIWLKRFQEGFWARKMTGSEFYHQYNDLAHSDDTLTYDPNKPLHISFDFNVIPYMTCTVYQIHYVDDIKFVYQIGEICLEPPKSLTEETCRVFKIQFPIHRHRSALYVYGDGTSRKRNTITDKNDFDVIMRELSEYQPELKLQANISTHMRGQWINKVLAEGDKVRFRINGKSSPNSRKDFLYVKLDEEGGKLKEYVRNNIGQKYQPYGHTSDALDYFMTTAFRRDFNRFQLGGRIKPHLIKTNQNDTWF